MVLPDLAKEKYLRQFMEDKNMKKISVKFTNKSGPRPVCAKEIREQH